MSRRWLMAVMVVVILLGSLVVPGAAPGAKAAAPSCGGSTGVPFGRAEYRGYFTNNFMSTGINVVSAGVPAWVVNTGTFITWVDQLRNASVPGTILQNTTAAQFIIDTMLGIDSSAADRNDMWNCWVPWVQRVQENAAYQGAGDWHHPYFYPCGSWNSMYIHSGSSWGDDTFYRQVVSTADSPCGSSTYIDSIVFRNPDGSIAYAIRRFCANPIGNVGPLPQADYNVNLTADTSGSPTNVVGGKTYTLAAYLNNTGPAMSEAGTLQIQLPTGVNQPCAPDCGLPPVVGPPGPPGQDPLLFGYGAAGGFRNGSAIPGVVGRNWYWNVAAMCAGCTTQGRISFTVSPGATVGSTIRFFVYYYKGNRAGAVKVATVDYRVVSERSPGVSGANSDVHAGGGICKQALSNGFVKGYPGAGSVGEYVVSASAANGINDFKTNGTGADSLRLGQNGAYAQVCRPDLVAAAQAYQLTGGYATISGSVDVNTLNPAYDVYFARGPVSLHGTVTRKITIVALASDVTINGPILIDTSRTYPSRQVPSLGIIAANNILINAAVAQVDAYMFANGTIDTCVGSYAACSTPGKLLVNGFVMARTISFNRLGPKDTNGAVITEQIVLNPQIYLNPPRLFDASVDDLLLEGQGERQPLF